MSLEDGVIGGTLMRLHVFKSKFELFALLVPLVDGHEQQLLVHLTAHDEEVAPEVVQLRAGAVRSVLDVQRELL